jgi:hypothetical protein
MSAFHTQAAVSKNLPLMRGAEPHSAPINPPRGARQ